MPEVNTYSSATSQEALSPAELAELELQQELRGMFNVDTQEYLQTYISLAQQLHPQSWAADIQELYRCIHTIKGGAVTVGAEAILHVSAVLEDLLSDLRYLQIAPPLADGQLSQILLEAGELLTGSLQIEAVGQAALESVQPTVERIVALRAIVQQAYLPEWDEHQQLFQEFAENGFDLVILELTMALEDLPTEGIVSPAALQAAKQTLQQLSQIGQDLGFEASWLQLLDRAQGLLDRPENKFWCDNWPPYLQLLKDSARKGGQLPQSDANQPTDAFLDSLFTETAGASAIAFDLSQSAVLAEPETASSLVPELDLFADLGAESESLLALDAFADLSNGSEPSLELDSFADLSATSALELDPLADLIAASESWLEVDALTALSDISESSLELDAFADLSANSEPLLELDAFADLSDRGESSLEVDAFVDLSVDDQPLLELDTFTDLSATSQPLPEADAFADLSIDSQASLELEASLEPEEDVLDWTAEAPQAAVARMPAAPTASAQIPVPLERLDRSAQDLVETLLSARAVQGFYGTLQTQLLQMVTLAQDSANYITRLRQIQDEYALLDNLQADGANAGPTLERYRQGYTIINRLLESSLRLSELGAEVSTSNHQTAESIQQLDRNILNLQKTVEESRLVPFKSLSFRARGILRDLTNRYGKPAQLVVQGEQLELDAGTAQALEPALLHLIRNAYDHGLEPPAQRLALGKPEQGTITLSLRRRGNTYALDLQDDGQGIDPEAIRQSAINKGLPNWQVDTPAALLTVLCQPGFSSRDLVSDISGRGVGMDVVANQVSALGGRLSLETAVGQGTTFCLEIPVPRLLVRCILVQSGDRTLAIPADEVVTTTLVDSLSATPADPKLSYSWVIQDQEQSVPGLNLLEYWYPDKGGRSLSETAVGLRVRTSAASTSSAKDAWLLADELLEQVDLLINPIPNPLVLPAGLMGVSLLTNGKLVPVLDPTKLAEHLLSHPISSPEVTDLVSASPSAVRSVPAAPIPDQKAPLTSTILVVDDAALVRRRIEASLTAYGYSVQTCRDGLEAWNWLQAHPTPALMISDIEMPGMDGFTLISRCRQAEMTMPVLVISSRLSEEWGNEARRLGATDYLTKGFTTPELLQKVSSFL